MEVVNISYWLKNILSHNIKNVISYRDLLDSVLQVWRGLLVGVSGTWQPGVQLIETSV